MSSLPAPPPPALVSTRLSDAPARTEVRVSSMQVRALVEAVEQVGTSAATFLTRAGFSAAQLADSSAWLTLPQFDAALASAVRLTGDEAFGLHWGERSPMMQFDLVPTLIATAPTLATAIQCILQLSPMLASRPEIRFREQRDRSVLAFDVLAISELGVRARTEVLVTGMTRLLRYLGAGDAIRRVNFPYPRPVRGAEYDRLFGSLVYFEQPEASIEFARSALDAQQAHHNIELHESIRKRTEQQRLQALGELSYGEQLEQHIRAALPALLSMADAARALSMSERSLRRRLVDEQLSYSELVDRVQQRLASELLTLGTKSVKEVAHALGFGSVSGFHRAYRRWTGETPAQQRSPRARS